MLGIRSATSNTVPTPFLEWAMGFIMFLNLLSGWVFDVLHHPLVSILSPLDLLSFLCLILTWILDLTMCGILH